MTEKQNNGRMNTKDAPVCADRTKRKLYATAHMNHNFRRVSPAKDPRGKRLFVSIVFKETVKQLLIFRFSSPNSQNDLFLNLNKPH